MSANNPSSGAAAEPPESAAQTASSQAAADSAALDAALGDLAGEAKFAALTAQAREASDRALRAQAELDNVRKRLKREFDEERKYALLPLVRDLLAVADNLDRAIAAAGQAGDSVGLLAGVKMVAAQFSAVLGQHQCVQVASVGQTFDPSIHQAVAQEASAEHPAGVVTRCHQAGYKLYDRVVRPAMVVVSTGPGA